MLKPTIKTLRLKNMIWRGQSLAFAVRLGAGSERDRGSCSAAAPSARALKSVGVGAVIFIPMEREFPRGKSEVGSFQSLLGMNHPEYSCQVKHVVASFSFLPRK